MRSLPLRLPRIVAAPTLVLLLAACGGTSPDLEAAAPADVPPVALRQLPEASTTTTAPPTTTTTAPPATTTTAPPPPPAAKQAAPPPATAPVVAAAAAPAPPPPPPPPAAAPGGEGRVLQLVNGERAGAGVPALRVNGGAASVARAWSAHMAQSGMAHNPDLGGDLDRAGVAWRTIAENVGYGSSVDQVHSMFMSSGGHRGNILSGAYNQVGIGVAQSGGRVWVTIVFVG
jgi:uncharacterized protein YkwD